MAKTREQMVEQHMGAMAMKIAVLMADLQEAHEELAKYKAAADKAQPQKAKD